MPHNAKVKTYLKDMEPVIAMQPDALIMADPGLIMMVRERFPDAVIHLSVQANTVNFAAVKFWQKLGLSRIILCANCRWTRSRKFASSARHRAGSVRARRPVHGLFRALFALRLLQPSRREPGHLHQFCRWDYKVENAQEDGSGDIQKLNLPLSISPPGGRVQWFPLPQAGEG